MAGVLREGIKLISREGHLKTLTSRTMPRQLVNPSLSSCNAGMFQSNVSCLQPRLLSTCQYQQNDSPQKAVVRKRTVLSANDMMNINKSVFKKPDFSLGDVKYLIMKCSRSLKAPGGTKVLLGKNIFDEVLNKGVRFDTEASNALLNLFVEDNFDGDLLALVKDVWAITDSAVNEGTYDLLIKGFAQQGDPTSALKTISLLMDHPEDMNLHTYVHLIEAFSKNGDMEGALEVFKSLKQKYIEPNTESYHHLINGYAQLKDVEGIDLVLQKMQSDNISPSKTTYLGILKQFVIGGCDETALDDVLARASDAGVGKGEIGVIIEDCICKGDYNAAVVLALKVNPMKKNRKSHYSYVMKNIFQKMQYHKKSPEEYFKIIPIMDGYLKGCDDVGLSNTLAFLSSFMGNSEFLSLMDLHVSSDTPVKVFRYILSFLAKKKDVRRVVNVYEIMLEKGIEIDNLCYHVALKEFGKPSSNEYKTFFSLVRNNENIIIPENYSASILKDEHVTLQRLASVMKNIPPKLIFLIRKYDDHFNFATAALATEVLLHCHKVGRQSDGLCYQLLSTATKSKEEANDLFAFVKDLRGEGVHITNQNYSCLLKSFQKYNMVDKFYTVVDWMKENGQLRIGDNIMMLFMASRGNNSMVAQSYMDKIKSVDKQRALKLYDPLVFAYVGDRDLSWTEKSDKLLHIYNDLLANGVKPNARFISIVKKLKPIPEVDADLAKLEDKSGLNEVEKGSDKVQIVDPTEVLEDATDVLADTTEVLADTTEVLVDATEVLVDATEVLVDATEVLADATEIQLDETEILGDGEELKGVLEEVQRDYKEIQEVKVEKVQLDMEEKDPELSKQEEKIVENV